MTKTLNDSCGLLRFQPRGQKATFSMTISFVSPAIKRGRYTHAKKAENILEVKRLLQERQQAKRCSPTVEMNPDPLESRPHAHQACDGRAVLPSEVQQDHTSLRQKGVHPSQQSGDIATTLRNHNKELKALIKEVSKNHKKFFGDTEGLRERLPEIEAQFLVNTVNIALHNGKLSRGACMWHSAPNIAVLMQVISLFVPFLYFLFEEGTVISGDPLFRGMRVHPVFILAAFCVHYPIHLYVAAVWHFPQNVWKKCLDSLLKVRTAVSDLET